MKIQLEILSYLQSLNQKVLGTEWSLTSIKFSMILSEMGHISKTIVQDLCDISEKMDSLHLEFSPLGTNELREVADSVINSFDFLTQAFATRKIKLADRVVLLDQRIVALENASRIAHISRLAEGTEKSVKTSELHLSFLDSLKRISNYMRSIAVQIKLAESIRKIKKKTENES
jgi:Na+/phosphate symporter